MTAMTMPMAEVQGLTDLSQINRLLQVGLPGSPPASSPPISHLLHPLSSSTGQTVQQRLGGGLGSRVCLGYVWADP